MLIIGLAMVIAAVLAVVMKPTQRLAESGPKVNLESMIPKQFGDWQLDETIMPLMISPEVQANLDKIYNQTLSRTYINKKGERIMLSIAYGGDQSDSMQVHKPEVCYPAQGFQVLKQELGSLNTVFGELPVKRLVAKKGARVEPITYWIKVGDEVAVTGLKRKLAQLKYGLTGYVPDGMLVRVSTIGIDEARGFSAQQVFVDALLSSVKKVDRLRLVGTFP